VGPGKAAGAVTGGGDDARIVDRGTVDNSATKNFAAAQLKLFAIRCCDLAERVAAHQLAFLDAVDLAYDAAISSGLADAVGEDIVQEVMVGAFFAVGRRPS
jgi:hypothetical protein